MYLVGGIPTSLRNMSSSVGMIIPNIWKKACSKPPTRYNDYYTIPSGYLTEPWKIHPSLIVQPSISMGHFPWLC